MRNVPHIRPSELGDLGHLFVEPPKTLQSQITAAHGTSFTFTVGDKVAAVVGLSMLWEGVWQGWAIVSPVIRGHGLFFTKHAKRILKECAERHHVRRYNIIVDATNVEHIRWATLLGFKYEYMMEKASATGTDVLGYVKWI